LGYTGRMEGAVRPEPRKLRKGDFAPATVALYRSGMLRRFGVLYYLSGLFWVLRRLRLSEASAENIRRAHSRGPVVYVLHTRSVLDWLALNRVLIGRRLPLAEFTFGIRARWLAPLFGLRETWAAVKHRSEDGSLSAPVRSGWFADAVSNGMTSAIFLSLGMDLGDLLGRPEDPMPALFDAQERAARPVQLVPVVVVWSRRPEVLRSAVGRFLLGSQDEPGTLEKLYAVATRNPEALVQAGAPVDLAEYIQRFEGEPPERQVRRLRILLRRYLYQESRVVKGPRVRSQRWIRRMVLTSPEVKELVRHEASALKKSEEKVLENVRRVFDRIAAHPSFPVVRVMAWIARQVWKRVYSGVDVREEDLEKIREAFRKGTPVLVPAHRSHLDYLLISSQLFDHDIVIPHVVAGDNLAFFPVGALIRRCGAFFVKRSFAGDRVFPVVFDRYLRQLVRDGVPIEFFIEGGRSRTGKLLPPKLGVLKMILDAAAGGREDREVTFLPIGIAYEEIAERRALAKELAGAEKEKEDLGQVVKATQILGAEMGRVHLRVGEPFTVREVFDTLGGPWQSLDRGVVREALRATGEKLMYRISKAMVMLPTGLVAMALLARTKRGIRLTELQERVGRLHTLLLGEGAVPVHSFSFGGWVVEEALQRFEKQKLVERLADQEGDILHVRDESRLDLDHHKNGLIHFIAPVSLYASALRAVGNPNSPEVFRLFQMQVFLFRYEFTLDPEATAESQAILAENALVDLGAMARAADGTLSITEPDWVAEVSGVTRNFVESYLLVLLAARKLRSRDIPLKDLAKKIQDLGDGYLAVEQLRRSESLSLENLKNAALAFKEEGVLQPRSAHAGLQYDEAAVDQYTTDLTALLT
jgi:glycerol-3-phosphate O-acyltransferase